MAVNSQESGESIDEIIDKYSDMIYRLAYSYVKTKHDAEDVYQDVFLRYISKPRSYDSEEHRKAWLLRVTINRCKSLLSSSWFRKTAPLDETHLGDTQLNDTEETNDLSDYLALLPPKYRPVIHLFYFEEMTTKQISRILHIKESTLRSWLSRARTILGENLKEGTT